MLTKMRGKQKKKHKIFIFHTFQFLNQTPIKIKLGALILQQSQIIASICDR
jgi:hypothetical protein